MPDIPSDSTNIPSAGSNSSNENEPQKATAQDYLSKGPQIPDQMPPKASREEIEVRKKELNK
ncbi:hypothetical protein BDV28DRAFT_142092 [Aspergillus coremiiformis]|uniref:Uncharacterized protein n=1 Tax=Aspergillus coremiiformis TaxID=138285 RepID=A0A5N6YX69_9EURO|nr:hypothetical protein BDV28DRAFT_142092 [Aspergillus coremiiformis]